MAFIPIPDSVKVSIEFVWAGQAVVLTAHFRKAGFNVADMGALADVVQGWWVGSARANMSNTIAISKVGVQDLREADAPYVELPIETDQAGSVAQASVPNNVALCVSLSGGYSGRSRRGRSYFPAIPVSGLADSNNVTSSVRNNIVGVIAYLGTLALAEGWQHVVASRFTGGAPRTVGITTPITSYFAGTILDSQRRRLAGRGS